jgi:hypothetical protein
MKNYLKTAALIAASPALVVLAAVGYSLATVVFGASRLVAGGKFYE